MAQPEAAKVQPDRLDFGTVYTGAIVEASFVVFEPGRDVKIEFDVRAPKHVKILSKSIEAQRSGRGEEVWGSVELAIDTTGIGRVDGELSVSFGRTKAKIPIKATIEKSHPGRLTTAGRCNTLYCYSTTDGSMFSTWTDCTKAKADMSYLLVRKEKAVLRDLDLTQFTYVLLDDGGLVFLLLRK